MPRDEADKTITVRRAEARDGQSVYLLARAFATSFAVGWPTFEGSYSFVLQSSEAFVAVAEKEAQVIGYLLGFDHFTFFANGRVSWVEEIMGAEEMRRQGTGRRLMESFEAWAKERQSKLVALATRRAAPFYRRLGYEGSADYLRKLL
jgi:GNAT superfamily N-acetyltransferase